MEIFSKKDKAKIIGVLLVVMLAIAVVPIAIIWSLNTLFPALAIAYSFWTWLAVFVLSVSTFGKGKQT